MMMHRSNPNPPSSFDAHDEDQRVGLQRLSPLPPLSPSSKLVYFCLADCNDFHWYPLRVSSDVEVKRVGLQLVMEIAHPAPDPFIYSESPPPSISSLLPLPRPPPSSSSSKIAYICLTDIDESYWYACQVTSTMTINNFPTTTHVFLFTKTTMKAIHIPKPCIVVGWPEDRVLRRYYVNTKNWVSKEFEIPKTQFFGPDDLMGLALAVDSMLYWYSARDTTACLIGYDLMRKTWFTGKFNVRDYGRSYIPEHTGPPPPPSLAHLGSDKFSLFWFSVVKCHPNPTTITEEDSLTETETEDEDEDEDEDEEKDKDDEYVEEVEEESLCIHCMKLRVTNGSCRSRSGIFPLEICSISCQSYLVAENATYFYDGLVV
ncbi:hypothetical protein LOK49_LG02G00261 [Camellia lanceoleosa]|uniref:Uncharacterized protein n=1 Tax=Camellia lanceoleosa TaxID=1840588 RepID=A0ACC0IPP5_9ERIC|nr:hypothetical protein LOK49_LG02G00261 [Camellia lanceoleosa]